MQFLDLVGTPVNRTLVFVYGLFALFQTVHTPIQFSPAVLQTFLFTG
jgi:hypothetical protein